MDLGHRFSKERDYFPFKDFVEAEAANTFPEGISYDSSCEPIEGAGNVVSVNFRVSFVRVRPIFQAIHRVSQQTEFGVSDCQFDFI